MAPAGTPHNTPKITPQKGACACTSEAVGVRPIHNATATKPSPPPPTAPSSKPTNVPTSPCQRPL